MIGEPSGWGELTVTLPIVGPVRTYGKGARSE